AQCHTRKYDPITQEEYFKFFAFFNNTEDADARDERPLLSIWSETQKSNQAKWTQRIEQLKKELAVSTPELQRGQQQWLAKIRREPDWTPLTPQAVTAKHRQLQVDAEGWIHASGEKSVRDSYQVDIPITADRDWVGLRLEVGQQQTTNFVLTHLTANWAPTDDRAAEARYVRVEVPGQGKFLHLAEVQAFSGGENVALAGKASQSSIGFGGKASFAIDGITDGDFAKNKTTHTNKQDDPWLEIDLTESKPIDRVVIWNRTDGGAGIVDRLKGFKITLLDDNRNVVWEHSPDQTPQTKGDYSPTGKITLGFEVALADFQQNGFPAQSVLSDKPDNKKGWAVGGQTGKRHQLTLMMKNPRRLDRGVLTIHLDQNSVHEKHLLDHFRVSATADVHAAQWAKMPTEIAAIVRKPDSQWNEAEGQQLAAYYRDIAPELKTQRQELAKLEKQLREMKPYTTVPIMRQLPADKRRVTKVQIRGNYLSTGDQVEEGTPVAFHPLPADGKPDRMALARWLIDPQNPLTPRVIANRHWEQLFGIGIVETSEEFGSQGELPSHPELLDWLAVELRDGGWDLKALVKLMVTSATYRQSSVTTPEMLQADPFNRLLARGPRFRVSAEMVRDQALFVSGLLSEQMYGRPVKPPQPELGLKAAFGSATDWQTSTGQDKYRRGIYTNWRRSSPYPSMAQFDAPNREVCTVRRIRTNTPLQALVTLNDPVYVESAQALARWMVAQGDSAQQRIQWGFRRCLIRDPSSAEVQRLAHLVEEATAHFAAAPAQALKMATEPIGALPDGADAAELAAWTVVGNVILNLDEIYMKR
ncbi:MAG: DUF1553 domain-containing protein, partial [Pirellulales bacterium]|nr:DUF1553 domain-containing protein [Pirellulales bacterium]